MVNFAAQFFCTPTTDVVAGPILQTFQRGCDYVFRPSPFRFLQWKWPRTKSFKFYYGLKDRYFFFPLTCN